MKNIALVAVTLKINKVFSYLIPDPLIASVKIGKRVLVPFRNQKLTGYVIGTTDKCEFSELKEIIQVLDETPLFSHDYLRFFKWLSSYYIAPIAQVIKTALPAGINVTHKEYYALTPAGEEYIESAQKGADLLAFIKSRPDCTVNAIKKEFPAQNVPTKLRKLKQKGYVHVVASLPNTPVTKTFVKHVELVMKNKAAFHDYITSLPKRATRRAKIALYILENGSVPSAYLNKRFNNVKKFIDILENMDYVSVTQKKPEATYEKQFEPENKHIVFTNEQEQAIDTINDAIDSNSYQPFLLHGITGSGKTEVYIQAAKRAIQNGKGVIILIPEIALTPNLLRRFEQHFDEIGVVHSSVSPRARYRYYQSVREGKLKMIIGARSAIFAPFDELGLIVIDEEHETTYKQDDGFKYNARDIALVRAKMKNAVVVLGSATPSVESYYNASAGKYKYLKLQSRVQKSTLPDIRIVDMKVEKEKGEKRDIVLSNELLKKIGENLENRQQTMLFLNRRGHSTFIVCYECGDAQICPNCSISLTYHSSINILVCHYCGFKKRLPELCPNCGGSRLKPVGFGTQRIFEEVTNRFPEASVFRMDSDTMTKKDSYKDFYNKMIQGEIDILIGTQMIAKGHDFANVTLVGILSADSALMLPDFRAEERCFAIITQVSGRAGRGEIPGHVIIQTLNPDNDSINFALQAKVDEYHQREIKLRRELNYPPFSRLINIRIVSKSESHGKDAFGHLARLSKKLLRQSKYKGVSLLGPVTCPIFKIKNKFRWQMLARSKDSTRLHHFVNELYNDLCGVVSGNYVKISIDVDPVNML